MKELTTVQQTMANTLQSDAVFTPTDTTKKIEVLTQKLGDLDSLIEQKINSIGISTVVITPLAKLPEPTVDALDLDVPFVVQISEDPKNKTKDYGALDLACEVMCLLHGTATGLGNPRVNRLRLTSTPLTLVDESPTYHVNFVAKITLLPRRAQPAPVAPPPTST